MEFIENMVILPCFIILILTGIAISLWMDLTRRYENIPVDETAKFFVVRENTFGLKNGQVFIRSKVPIFYSENIVKPIFQYKSYEGPRYLIPYPKLDLVILELEKINADSNIISVMFPNMETKSFIINSPPKNERRWPDMIERDMKKQGLPIPEYTLYRWQPGTPPNQGEIIISTL